MQSLRSRVLLGLALAGAAIVLTVAVTVSSPDEVASVDTPLPSTTAPPTTARSNGRFDTPVRVDDAVVPSVMAETTVKPKASATSKSRKRRTTTTRSRRSKRTTTTVSQRKARSFLAGLMKTSATTTPPVPNVAPPAVPPANPPTTAPPSTAPPTTAPPTTEPPTTEPPTTEPPTTEPPTTEPPTTAPPQVLANPFAPILEMLGLPTSRP